MGSRRAENAATRLFQVFQDTPGPPIDPWLLAKDLEVEVVERPGLSFRGEEASGMLLRKDGQAICVLNKDHHPNRKRFIIAHEIGHFILHPYQECYVDLRNRQSGLGIDSHELEANAFAAELLMPQEALRRGMGDPLRVFDADSEIKKLARIFKISPLVMGCRLASLNLLALNP